MEKIYGAATTSIIGNGQALDPPRRQPESLNLLSKSHPVDVAHLFHDLERHEQRILFELISDPEMSGTVLSELDPEVSAQLLENLNKEQIVTILDEMANDDAVDVIQTLPESLAEEILQLMEDEYSQEIEQLLQYDEDTAGGIMSTDIFSLSEEMTVREAIDAIQQAEDVEMVFIFMSPMFHITIWSGFFPSVSY